MSGSTRAGLAALLLVVVWIVVYWRTTPKGASADAAPAEERVQGRPFTAPTDEAGRASHGPFQIDLRAPAPLGGMALPEPTLSLPTTPTAGPRAEQLPTSAPTAVPVSPGPTAPPAPKPGETIPPTFDLYEVQPGDNAQTISQKRYGTTKHWRAVLKANPLLDFTRLRPGKVIKVPHDPENTQGFVVPTEKGDFVDYTVTQGDTLMGIAQALYGKSSQWRRILDANPDLNEDGTNLKPGMKLKVPPPTQAMPR